MQAGDVEPLLGHGSLHGHAATDRQSQVREIEVAESRRVQQRGEQRVDAGDVVEPVIAHFLDEAREIARIGNEYVLAALGHHRQAVTL